MPDDSTRQPAAPTPPDRRLESWKEIAAYLGRDVRTVQRWEGREGLPVHRLQHRKLGSVYAHTSELDAWRQSRDLRAEAPPDRPARRSLAAGPRARTLAASVAAVLALAAGTLAWWAAGRADAEGPVQSVAVLPFEDLSETQDAYFADGLTEALIGRLSALRDLRVISRASIMQFKGTEVSPLEVASSLNVDAAVVSSVRRVGDRVRITVELVRADSGENLWASTFDRPMGEVLAVQSEVAQAIAAEIKLHVTPAARELLGSGSPVSPATIQSYLTGTFKLNAATRTRAAVEQSLRHFEDALARDPTFAPAHVGLARAYWVLGTTGIGALPVTESQPLAVAAATRALELDPNLSDALEILAQAHEQAWKWADAERGYRRALEITPSDAAVHRSLGALLTHLGRTEEGLGYARRGRDLDPLTPQSTVELGWTLYHARRYDDAIRELRTVLAADPGHVGAMWYLGFALIDALRHDEAIATLERLAVAWNRNSAGLGVLARAYAAAGRMTDAQGVIHELEQRAEAGYVPPAVFVNAYSALGDADRMFAAMQRAYEERSNIVRFLKTHPVYDAYRGDRRFHQFLARVGLD